MTKNKFVSLMCPLVFLAFGIWMRISTLAFTKRDAVFPNMVAYLTIAISLIDFITEFRKVDHKDRFKGVNFIRLLASIASMFVYVFLIKRIGFLLDTILLCGFTMWILGYRKWKVVIPCAIGIAAVVFGVFYGLMKVPLPTIIL